LGLFKQIVELFRKCGVDKECLHDCWLLIFSGEIVCYPEYHYFTKKFINLLEEALKTNAFPYVKELKLYGTKIKRDNSLKSILQGLENNTTIRKLDLGYTDLTNEDVVDIANVLKSNHTLEEISLYWSAIDDKGADQLLTALLGNKQCKIKKLDLSDTYVKDGKKQEMKKALNIAIT
jgi:Ran GTPase-activating protein (RanGAP) involved in mRNA processing and transport